MTTTKTRKIPTAIEVVADYVERDREIKLLEAERLALKPAALAALSQLGESVETAGALVTSSYPSKTTVDIVVLRENTSPRLFRELTKPTHDLVKIRARLTVAKVVPPWAVAISEEPDTPRLIITPRP